MYTFLQIIILIYTFFSFFTFLLQHIIVQDIMLCLSSLLSGPETILFYVSYLLNIFFLQFLLCIFYCYYFSTYSTISTQGYLLSRQQIDVVFTHLILGQQRAPPIHYFEGGQGGDRPPSGDWCWGLVPPMAKKNCPPSES